LKTAVALRSGSDAGESEMLDLTIGEALEHNPANVFRTAAGEFQLSAICCIPDIDDARYNSYELSIKAVNRRIRHVSSLKNQAFASIAKECVQYLEKSKSELARVFEVKK
jgi:hypothetical protein